MKYAKEFNVFDFTFWAGAEEKVKKIAKAGKMLELGEQIEEHFCGKSPTAEQINDYVWFDDQLMEQLGLGD